MGLKIWLKCPKAVPWKTKFGPKCKWFKTSYLKFFVFENIISVSDIQRFYICPQVSMDIIRCFFYSFDFLAESLKSNKNWLKRSLIFQYSLAQKTSLILTTSTHLTLKIIYSHNAAKNLSYLANFPASIFLFGVKKSICTAPFLKAQELNSWSTLKANVCIFLYISVRKCLFLRRGKNLSGLERQNNFSERWLAV